MGRLTYVALVRHGERLDEADKFKWSKIRTHENQFNPPLTTLGYKQSRQAGKKISKWLGALPKATAVYSSPTSRTLGTAAAIALELDLQEVRPAYGLNCCAAAKMTGVASRYFQLDKEALLGLEAAPIVGDAKEVNARNRKADGFLESIRELASAHEEETLVMVSHREGIWEVLQHFRRRPHKEYCSIHYLWFDHETGKLGLLEVHDRPLLHATCRIWQRSQPAACPEGAREPFGVLPSGAWGMTWPRSCPPAPANSP